MNTALLLLAAASSAVALDFRPVLVESRGEGGKYTYLEFRDLGNTVTYMPPRTWRFHGGATRLSLTAPDTKGVEIDIGVLPLREPMPVDAAHLSAFASLALLSLPAEAVKVEQVAVDFNPLLIDGHATVEVTFKYVIFGGPIEVSYLYAARENALICFRVVARPEDFDRLHQTFRLSLYSFAGL